MRDAVLPSVVLVPLVGVLVCALLWLAVRLVRLALGFRNHLPPPERVSLGAIRDHEGRPGRRGRGPYYIPRRR